MFRKYDYVRVVDCWDRNNDDLIPFLNKEGMIIGTDAGDIFPYEIAFFDKHLQNLSIALGIVLWRERDLEKIE